MVQDTLGSQTALPLHQRPVVAVIGTTGVGKSQLAVFLAQSLLQRSKPSSSTSGPGSVGSSSKVPSHGIVLSADSMQLYKGLDVITNKVTEEEMGGVEHWGLDVVSPGQGGSWEVGKWCGEASKKVNELSENTLPVICGGTHYFIQHFLFPPADLSFSRPSTPDNEKSFDPHDVRWKPPGPRPPVAENLDPALCALLDTFWTTEPTWPNEQITQVSAPSRAGPSRSRPTAEDDHQALSLYRLLEAIDPNEAARWHWRDGRKVRRGIERWWERGGGDVRDAPVTEEKKESGRRARFRTLIFWVYEPLETLRPRLDMRVDRMLENGLLREIAEMREIALKMYGSPHTIDHTEGIFQSIGYKEFAGLDLSQSDPKSDPAFPPMLAQTKLRTHQYAKSQLKWIRKQLLPAVREARSLGGEVEVYVVPGGAAGEQPAREALEAFLAQTEMPDWKVVGHTEAPALLEAVYNMQGENRVPDTAARQVINSRKVCDVCSEPGNPFSVAVSEWDQHLKSRPHRRIQNRLDGTVARIKEEQMSKRDAVRAEREKLKAEKALQAARAAESL